MNPSASIKARAAFSMIDEAIKQGDLNMLSKNACNDLYLPAIRLNSEVEKNLSVLKELAPEYASMTGSGSTCFSMYTEYEMASWAYNKLKKQGYNVDLLYYYDPNAKGFFDKIADFFNPQKH